MLLRETLGHYILTFLYFNVLLKYKGAKDEPRQESKTRILALYRNRTLRLLGNLGIQSRRNARQTRQEVTDAFAINKGSFEKSDGPIFYTLLRKYSLFCYSKKLWLSL